MERDPSFEEKDSAGALPNVREKPTSFGPGKNQGDAIAVVAEALKPRAGFGIRRVQPHAAKPIAGQAIIIDGEVVCCSRPGALEGSARVKIEGSE